MPVNKTQTLDDFVNEVLKKLIMHFPDTAISKLEEVSYLLKHNKRLEEFLRVEDNRNYKSAMKESLQYIEAQ